MSFNHSALSLLSDQASSSDLGQQLFGDAFFFIFIFFLDGDRYDVGLSLSPESDPPKTDSNLFSFWDLQRSQNVQTPQWYFDRSLA